MQEFPDSHNLATAVFAETLETLQSSARIVQEAEVVN
jgi:hypothetical protein